jgi:uncharacterized protein YcbK (DUF882 family)
MNAIVLTLLLATVHQARVLHPHRAAAPPPPSMSRKASWPAAELYAVNLNETLRYRPFDDRGRARPSAERELTRFLRCWHTGKQRRADARLGRLLYKIARHYPGHRIEVFSGFRPRAYCTRKHSRHLTASAVDFRVAGIRNESLIEWLRSTFHPVGVGYYPNGVHVHLDVDRHEDTYWVDAGDAPKADPLVAIGETAPAALEATADEPVEAVAPPGDPVDDPADELNPPADDPQID